MTKILNPIPMRKPVTLIILSLLLLATSFSYAQKASISRDSILQKYLHNGAYQYAIYSQSWNVYLDSALAILPQDAFLWQQKAMPYFKTLKYEVGMAYLDSAVKYNQPRYIDYRGFIKCIFLKDYTAAIADFQLASQVNGDIGIMDHEYRFYIGLSYLQLNKYDSAASCFRECIRRQQARFGDSMVHHLVNFYMGITLYEQQEYAAAISYFDKALQRYSNFSDAKFYKALCMGYLQQDTAAMQLYEEAVKDFKDGFTINEDNAIYERYPYQVNSFLLSRLKP
ncbi:tetratricopeptide repeat protein [Chitinophaga sp. Cy-1792]|uniref:tetratricopeptide repeat protein n=1 Tax=Chitinophaga sp. Cy-1792 TaxID=2608339 RepID=UPI0014238379|nr:tetratricopeptide repeat protein [Chitinophaga sp. Cy-1792]NIG55439.1 tetratricopeptide repeat protein [Chitinophaga sp. Cy-1792]